MKTRSLLTAVVLTAASSPLYALDSGVESQIDALMAPMTLEEKVGQMVMANSATITPEQVTTHAVGSLLVNASSTARDITGSPPGAWADKWDVYQQAALDTDNEIPLIIGVDAVHGHALVEGATVFPHNVGLAATGNPELMREMGEVVAREVAATGCDWILAPCVAVSRDIRWGRTYEGWGETALNAEGMIGAFIEGVQTPYNGNDGVVACAKHFIADGGATWSTGPNGGIDQGDVQLDEATMRAVHLPPYEEAIAAGVGSIMVSYGTWNGVEMHHNQYLLTDVLKEELGFEGFIVSDYNGFWTTSEFDLDEVESAVNAGVDLFMMNERWEQFIPGLIGLVNDGDVEMARIDDAVRRILRVKITHGLFDQPLADREIVNGGSFGSTEHMDVARQAVRESLVLLKNEGNLLPLDKDMDVQVVGRKADDIGVQSGGWTLEWGGLTGAEAADRISGVNVLEGIEAMVGEGSGSVTYSPTSPADGDFDVTVVVVGENPTAEWQGDTIAPSITAAEAALIRNTSAKGVPTVVILLSGRSLTLNNTYDSMDALVAAWLPGSAGDGVAAVLFGDAPFVAQSPHSWPVETNQLPLNLSGTPYRPQFPLKAGHLTAANAPQVDNGPPLPFGSVDVAYQRDLNLREFDAENLGVVEGDLPDGLSLSQSGMLTGTPSASGAFGALVEAENGSGDVFRFPLVLEVVDGQDYAAWAGNVQWPNGADESESGDPDGDGVSNALEFQWQMDPTAMDAWLPVEVDYTAGGSVALLRMERSKAVSAPVPRLQFSTDLETWAEAGAQVASETDDAQVLEFPPPGEAPAPRLFWRALAP